MLTNESSFQDIVRQVMMKFYSLLHISILSQTKLQLVNMMKFYMLKLLEKKCNPNQNKEQGAPVKRNWVRPREL